MNNLYKILIVLALCSASFAIGKYTAPEKIVTKTEVVEKEVIVDHTDIKKNTQTKIVENWYPDGRYTKETYILDQDTVVVEHNSEKEILKTIEKTIENGKPQWVAAVGAGYNFDITKPIYNVQVERRILGPFFLGAYGTTNREIGALLRMEF